MLILYGIQTTGLGHISRSLKIIKSLEKRGHKVHILTSGNYQDTYLFDSKHFTGLTLIKNNSGGIDLIKTLFRQKFLRFIGDIKNFPRENNYDFIVSDFEPISSWIAKTRKIKLFSVSNQSNFLSKKFKNRSNIFRVTTQVMKWISPPGIPVGFHWKPFDNFIYNPIIRDEILEQDQKKVLEDYYLVYLNNMSVDSVIKYLGRVKNENFVVYSSQNIESSINNIKIKHLDFKSFTQDLASSKGVITSGGFSTITESIYLQKKLMCIPQKNQPEQLINAYDLEDSGFFVSYSLDNIEKFIESEKITLPKWSDPTENIVENVLLKRC